MVEVFKLEDFIVRYNEVFIKSNDNSDNYLVYYGAIYEDFKEYFADKYKLTIHKVIADFTGKSLIVVLAKDEISTVTLKMLPDCKVSIDIEHDDYGVTLEERIVLTFPLFKD